MTCYRMCMLSSILLASMVLIGCQSTTLMPHSIGYGKCSSGNCSNGLGTLTSKELGVSYTGLWRGGAINSGEYQVNFKGDEYTVLYKDGRPVSGIKFFNQHGHNLDFFNGSWQTYEDPFSKLTISFPNEGIYHSATGARYIGRFFAVPTRGVLKSHYEDNPDNSYRVSFANVIFTGELRFRGQAETVILGLENYVIGSSMVYGSYGTGLSKSDLNKIAEFKRRHQEEISAHNYARQSSKSSGFDFTQLIAVASAVSTAAYGIDSGLTSDSAAELGMGMYSLVADGNAEALSKATNNLEFDQSRIELQRQIDEEVKRIERQYAAKSSIAHQEYLDGVRRSSESKAKLESGASKGDTFSTSANKSTAGVSSSSSRSNTSSYLLTNVKAQSTSTKTHPVAKVASNNTSPSPPRKQEKPKRTRTITDKIHVEAIAYCLQSKKTQKWWCDGPVQKLILFDNETLLDASKYVGCENHNTARSRSFMTSKDVNKGKTENGTLLYCEQGIESYDRDIAKIYQVGGALKQARNTYKCYENQVRTCTTLFERNKGNVDNFQFVERVEEY